MILSNDDMRLQRGDTIITSAVDGTLFVQRMVELRVCRCRECEDRCERLCCSPHTTCVICHNNHSQAVDGVYAGPLKGARGSLDREPFADLDSATMTCRLCGSHWGEGHDMPGRCPFYNSDGARFPSVFSGKIPPFQGGI